MRNRKIKDNEFVNEYYLRMKEITNTDIALSIDDHDLMQYAMIRTWDKHENKLISCTCKDLREFRDKIKAYKTFKMIR